MFKAIGNAIGNVLGTGDKPGILGGGKVPTPQTVELDPATKNLIESQVQRANESPEQIQEQLLTGVGRESQALTQPRERFQVSADVYDQALENALNKRAQNAYAKDLVRVQKQAEFDAPLRKFARSNINQALVDQNKIAAQNYQIQYQSYQRQLAERNSVIAQILGISGQVMGAGLGQAPMNKQQYQAIPTQQPQQNYYSQNKYSLGVNTDLGTPSV